MTLQQIINERISFLKEQINHENKPGVNFTFQLQIDAIRSVDDYILKKLNISSRKRRLYQKIVKMSMTQTDCLQSLMGWNGCRGK
jgi:uncharacterized protein YeeX (DUF496 family)